MATPAQTARSIFDALAKRELDEAMSYGADEAVDDFVAIGEFRGKRAIREFFENLFIAFPDFEVTVHRVVGDDEVAVVQWSAAGTFSGGPFQGVQPTGKHVEIRGVDVMEFADGLLRHNTIYYDGASFARQVGLLPKAGSGADRAILSAFNAATNLRKRRHERMAAYRARHP